MGSARNLTGHPLCPPTSQSQMVVVSWLFSMMDGLLNRPIKYRPSDPRSRASKLTINISCWKVNQITIKKHKITQKRHETTTNDVAVSFSLGVMGYGTHFTCLCPGAHCLFSSFYKAATFVKFSVDKQKQCKQGSLPV